MVREELEEIYDALSADPPIMYSIERAYEAYEKKGSPAGRVYDNVTGDLPLHTVCKHKVDDIEIVQFLYNKDPDSIKLQNEHRLLPIHLACNGPDSHVEIVKFLYEKWNESIKMGTGIGNLPIHVACVSRAPISIVRYLKEQNPKTLLIANRKKQTPLDCAKNEDKKPALPHVVKLLGGDTEELTTHMQVLTGHAEHD